MKYKKSFLALICALSLFVSSCVHAEISKSREYEIEEIYGDDGKKITITERNPEDEDHFNPDGTVVKDTIYDFPDSEMDEVIAKITIPENTKGISVYVNDNGWHKVKITVKKKYIKVPIRNHKRHKIIIHHRGKSPKTGESYKMSGGSFLWADGMLILAASIGAIFCYRKKDAR